MKKGNKTSQNKKFNSERETRVLLGKIHSEVKTIAEGHGALASKLGDIDKRLSKIESNSFKNEWNIESIKSKAGTIDTKVDRIEKELETVKNALLDISKSAKDHGKRITKLEEKVHM